MNVELQVSRKLSTLSAAQASQAEQFMTSAADHCRQFNDLHCYTCWTVHQHKTLIDCSEGEADLVRLGHMIPDCTFHSWLYVHVCILLQTQEALAIGVHDVK